MIFLLPLHFSVSQKKTGVFFIHEFDNRFKTSPVKLLKIKGLHFLTETTLLACVFIPKRCLFL